MTTFTSIPKQIKEVLERRNGSTSRRDFLKGSGMFVVSLSAVVVTDAHALSVASASGAVDIPQGAGPYPDPGFQ